MGTLHIQRLDSEPGYPQITGAANVLSKADGGGSLLARAVHASTGGARGLVQSESCAGMHCQCRARALRRAFLPPNVIVGPARSRKDIHGAPIE